MVNIKTDKRNKMQYIKGATSVLYENGILLSRSAWDTTTDIQTVLNRVEKETTQRYDWKYACTTGKLRKKAKRAKKAKKVLVEEEKEMPRVEATTNEPKEPAKQQSHAVATHILIIEAIMLVVGISCAVMSAYHTYQAQLITGKQGWVALFTGIILVLFSTTAFTAGRFFFSEKTFFGSVFGFVFLAMGICIIFYSLLSTATVNSLKFKQQVDKDKKVAFKTSADTLQADTRLAPLKEQVEQKEQVLAQTTKDMEYWRNRSWDRYDELVEKSNLLQNDIDSLNDKIYTLLDTTTVTTEDVNVYSIVQKMLHIPAKVMQVIMFIVPALCYDIFAPFSFIVVYYIEDKKRSVKDA